MKLRSPTGTEVAPADATLTLARLAIPAGDFGPELAARDVLDRLAAGNASPEHMEAIGAHWLNALRASPRLSAALDAIPPGERLLLDFEDSELGQLPWELLRAQAPWFTNPDRPVALGGGLEPQPSGEDPWPLRVLVVVGTRPPGAAGPPDPLRADEELAALEDALEADRSRGHAQVWLSRGAARADVRDAIAEHVPHVLHVIAHGELDGGEAFLELWDQAGGQPVSWRAPEILNDLQGLPAPRFVFLNTCRSAAPGATASLMRVFRDLGAGAVLGMQTPIEGRAAALFARVFYESFAGGDPLDVATAKARQRLVTPHGLRNATAPRLWVRALPEQALRFAPGIASTRRTAVEACHILGRVRAFVGRRPQRWRCWQTWSPASSSPNQDLLVIRGPPKAGKSWLAKLILERHALRGDDVRYAILGNQGPSAARDLVGALCAIRTMGPDPSGLAERGVLDQAFSPEAFAAFDRRSADLGPPAQRTEHDLEALCREFVTGVATSVLTREAPLVLALDQVSPDLATPFRTQLFPWVVVKLLRHAQAAVRVILVLNDGDVDGFLSPGTGVTLRVPKLPPEEYPALASAFLRRTVRREENPTPPEVLQGIVTAFAPTIRGEWIPQRLNVLWEAIRGGP